MALKDLLVYADKTNDALARLRLAVDLAARHGSRLTALYVREWDQAQQHERKTAELGLASGVELGRLDDRIGASNDHAEDELVSREELDLTDFAFQAAERDVRLDDKSSTHPAKASRIWA
jgi:hypothetical protein